MEHYNQLSILRLENGILHVQWQGEWALATQKGPTESSSLTLVPVLYQYYFNVMSSLMIVSNINYFKAQFVN